MELPRLPRAAALGAALSAALVVGMAGTAIAFSPPDPPLAQYAPAQVVVPAQPPATTPALANRPPAP